MNSLVELQQEKFRLQREILETEEDIKTNYHSLVDALTFRNLINTVAEEIIATNFIVSQAYSIIRPLFQLKKKKKKIVNDQLNIQEPKVKARKTIKKKRVPKTELILKQEDDE